MASGLRVVKQEGIHWQVVSVEKYGCWQFDAQAVGHSG